ncbi:hypothetical protein Mal64_21550 [Pseudobythopirellula maris]|uniref:Uncharacterized protein n=1 Tax=Pseudobythopirellula maris TaxID=2527991 RepID=A0A5C5ZNC0_9BACT|nr:BBP7 family outer membrane beta-barrel protein [Pseudobythopirellula maris]TWT88668.1 hypothetical protein Mal64_21550 [Pseudobythopirellula maris]
MASPQITTAAAFAAILTALTMPALAQNLPTPMEEMPPSSRQTLTMPGPTLGAEPTDSAAPSVDDVMRVESAESSGVKMSYDDYAMNQMPALTESSATWLRRGIWYADLEGVVYDRVWDREELSIATNTVAFGNNLFDIGAIGVNVSDHGSEGHGRLTLGRFLFRDLNNRDHTAEMVVFGGGEHYQRQQADSTFPGGITLTTSVLIDSTTPSLDQSDSMSMDYDSRFHSWEWNYRVAERLNHDRMELMPSGNWVRRAPHGYTKEYLFGLRLFDLEEELLLEAQGVRSVNQTDGSTDGDFRVKTSNNLFGPQFGLGLTYETDRWNVSFHGKNGVFINDASLSRSLAYNNSPSGTADDFSREVNRNKLSYMMQAGIVGRYHLRPNLSLRASYEVMYVTSVALAPDELDFTPEKIDFSVSGDPFYHGVSFGTEYYW